MSRSITFFYHRLLAMFSVQSLDVHPYLPPYNLNIDTEQPKYTGLDSKVN